jgi:hypothetical protein
VTPEANGTFLFRPTSSAPASKVRAIAVDGFDQWPDRLDGGWRMPWPADSGKAVIDEHGPASIHRRQFGRSRSATCIGRFSLSLKRIWSSLS